jgi:hypothetical protein
VGGGVASRGAPHPEKKSRHKSRRIAFLETDLMVITNVRISVNHRFDKKGIFGKVKSPKPIQTKEAQTNDTAIRAKS